MPVSMLMETKHVDGKGRELIARCGDIPVFAAPLEVLTELTGFHLTRGMLCAMRRPKLPEAAELCRNASRIAVLENVMNPTNIGAIFRSAAALGVDAVLLTSAGSDPLYRRAMKGQHGHGISGAVDIPAGRLAQFPARSGLQNSRDRWGRLAEHRRSAPCGGGKALL